MNAWERDDTSHNGDHRADLNKETQLGNPKIECDPDDLDKVTGLLRMIRIRIH